MLTIGEFSKACFVTRKTLRYYDEIGLLRPSYTAENGYRYYTGDQVRTMRMIARLKGYGCSLPEIAAVLAREGDHEFLLDTLAGRKAELRRAIDRQERLLRQLEQDMEKLKGSHDLVETNITIKFTDRQPVRLFGIRRMMGIADFDGGYAELYGQAAQKRLAVTGVPHAIYHDREFNPDCSDIELAVPVGAAGEGTRELPGGLHAYATHIGPFDEAYSATYGQIVEYIDQNGYEMCGPPFDEYVKSHTNGAAGPEDFITNIYFPVRKK